MHVDSVHIGGSFIRFVSNAMLDISRLLQLLGIDARRRRSDWWALCPFHGDSDPSWHMVDKPGSRKHGSHHCHGCEIGGGPLDLVRHVLGFVTIAAARKWLADNGLAIEDKLPVALEVVSMVARAARQFSLPRGTVIAPLREWVTPARRYVESRGITAEQVDRWQIGYAATGRLKGRIVFPFRAADDTLTSYSARSFGSDSKRYLTPDESEAADPAAIFGANRWQADRRRLVLTEGVINALACERAGAETIGALNGSHLSEQALLQLGTFDELMVAVDPDHAGDRVWRQLKSLARWTKLRRAAIPIGYDAAELPAEELARLIA